MTLIPRRDFVVVKLEEKKDTSKTASGIFVVQKNQVEDRQQMADVVAVGEGIYLENGQVLPLGLKVGDKVLINKYAGTEMKLDDESYVLMHDKDILAIVK